MGGQIALKDSLCLNCFILPLGLNCWDFATIFVLRLQKTPAPLTIDSLIYLIISVVARYVPKLFPKKNVEVTGNLGNLRHCGWDRWMVDAGNKDINVIGNLSNCGNLWYDWSVKAEKEVQVTGNFGNFGNFGKFWKFRKRMSIFPCPCNW